MLAVLLMMGESAISLANPWIAGRLTELVVQPAAPAGLDLLGLMTLWALLLAGQSGLSFGNRYLLGSTGAVMLTDLRSRLYDHLQALPLGYFHEKRRGEVLALLGNDAGHISSFVTGTLVGLLPLLMTFVGALYFLHGIKPSDCRSGRCAGPAVLCGDEVDRAAPQAPVYRVGAHPCRDVRHAGGDHRHAPGDQVLQPGGPRVGPFPAK